MHAYFNRKTIVSFVASLMFLSNIFIYAPILIYQGNLAGFKFFLPLALAILLVPFFIALLLLTLLCRRLSDPLHQRVVVILSSLGLLFWVQSTFLTWNLGVLDGSLINWSKGAWRGVVDGLIWVIFLGSAIAGYRRLYRYALHAGALVLISQFAMVCMMTFLRPEMWYRRTHDTEAPPKEVFEFSTGKNVLHIVLDQFGTGLFKTILQENKNYADSLDGFTFFKEVTTSSHVTCISVPSFLSGNIYTNNMPVKEFFKENYMKNNVQSTLHENGYDLDMVNQPGFLEQRDIDTYYYNVPTPYYTGRGNKVYIYKAAFLADLSLFRCVPFFVKMLIYNNQNWLISSLFLPSKDSKFEHFSANEFLEEFTARASVQRNKQVYKYIHLDTPHPPLVIDCNLEFVDKVFPETVPVYFKYQAEYTLKRVFRLLKRLKQLDLYNPTLIIVQSDHGSGIPFELQFPEGDMSTSLETLLPSDAFLPLLLIKRPNDQGTLRASVAQGELTDLPATICSLLNIPNQFPGQSLYEIDTSENRMRSAFYSSVTHRNDAMVSGYFEGYQEYIASGSVFKVSSWKKGRIMEKMEQPYVWGTVLKFNNKSKINSYLNTGWGSPEEDHTWSNGKTALLKFPITPPKNDMIEISCVISPFLVPSRGLDKQPVEISINNKKVGEFLISSPGQQTLKLVFPKKLVDNTTDMLVGFSLPNATVGTEMGLEGESRMLGMAFYSISFNEH